MGGVPEGYATPRAASKTYAKSAGNRAPLKDKGNFARRPHLVRVPEEPTPEQVEIGRAILEIYMPNANPRAARLLMADIYRNMIRHRPPPFQGRWHGLTATQLAALDVVNDLAAELRRYPSLDEEAARRGVFKSTARNMRRLLVRKGVMRLWPDGTIRSAKRID